MTPDPLPAHSLAEAYMTLGLKAKAREIVEKELLSREPGNEMFLRMLEEVKRETGNGKGDTAYGHR